MLDQYYSVSFNGKQTDIQNEKLTDRKRQKHRQTDRQTEREGEGGREGENG